MHCSLKCVPLAVAFALAGCNGGQPEPKAKTHAVTEMQKLDKADMFKNAS